MSRTSWDDAFLDSLVPRPIGRRDTVIAGMFSGTGDVTSAFRALVVQHHETTDPARQAFPDQESDVPAWVDPALGAAGQERFARWGSNVFNALYAAALPSAYACWRAFQVRAGRMKCRAS